MSSLSGLRTISIHALREEGDVDRADVPEGVVISIHALREEGDRTIFSHGVHGLEFLSTPSARRATSPLVVYTKLSPFLSTPSARRATEGPDVTLSADKFLSTPSARRATSARATCKTGRFLFLSTPSARRATLRATSSPCFITYFYPRPPRGGRLRHHQPRRLCAPISIHALREEGDRGRHRSPRGRTISIHALREEGDLEGCVKIVPLLISIHALREEGDRRTQPMQTSTGNFYPRPPRGGRRARQTLRAHCRAISIHALREEGDMRSMSLSSSQAYFYPRPPRGGRRNTGDRGRGGGYFYPRPPRGGRPAGLFADLLAV